MIIIPCHTVLLDTICNFVSRVDYCISCVFCIMDMLNLIIDNGSSDSFIDVKDLRHPSRKTE